MVTITLVDGKGREVRIRAMVDDGAIVAVIDVQVYEKVKDMIEGWAPSDKLLRMADRTLVKSIARWCGKIRIGNVEVEGVVEVLDSKGGWSFLFGKPLLEQFRAVHDYENDTITVKDRKSSWKVFNEGLGKPIVQKWGAVMGVEDHTAGSGLEALVTVEDPGKSESTSGRVFVDTLAPLYREVFHAPMAHLFEINANTQNQYGHPRAERVRWKRLKPTVEEVEDEDDAIRQTREKHWEAETGMDAAQPLQTETTTNLEEPSQQAFRELEQAVHAILDERAKVRERWEKARKRCDKEEAKRKEANRVRRTKEWRGVGARRWCRWSSRLEKRAKLEKGPRTGTRRTHRRNERRRRQRERKHARNPGGHHAAPSRGVSTEHSSEECQSIDSHIPDPQGNEPAPVCVVSEQPDGLGIIPPNADIIPDSLDNSATKGIFTRNEGSDGAFRPERVQEILRQVKIGSDLTDEQRKRVETLLSSYADCFALSVSEVRHVEGAVHTLNIPEGAKFSKRVRQKALTPPQREYLHGKIDELLAAGVIEQCTPDQVKCVSPLTLARKAHEGGGLTVEELKHRVNNECIAAGLPPSFDLPPRPSTDPSNDTANSQSERPAKWRICQNFGEVNRVTGIAPMPQGDIRTKQRALSGHRYICLFNFASGFYAVDVDPESRPYTAFYVEGRGYFWCAKMPFGLTGAPSTFADMTAKNLGDVLTNETIHLFVDDGGSAADTFEDMFARLIRILERVRERNLSLSASKSEFFVSEGIFAGGKVSEEGVTADPTKLTAIVDWKQPKDALNLASFIGLTGHFRDLIRNYARIEGPLRNLLKSVPLPANYNKSTYRRAMETFTLDDKWTEEHTKSFLALKTALVSEPVLRAPIWDNTNFIVTTDGCKEGYAAVLAQRFKTVLPNGKEVEKLHPIAFASKRTSASEKNYKPFLLEFAALKFGLDKFSDTIWGFPVEIETDCQALRDVLMSDKMNAAHARWRDGILAHNIVDVRHIPGKLNVVADGLSRMWEGHERVKGDGSEWTVNEDWEGGLVNDLFTIGDGDEMTELRNRFAQEPIFMEVLAAIETLQQPGDEKAKARAVHKASRYMIDEGKLWKVGGNGGVRARARVECISREEAVEKAQSMHEAGGHWGRDLVKLAMMDRYWSPKLDESILTGIRQCARCKNFGPTHLHSLLNPITRRHPFELLVGDYLSMSKGKGSYHNIGLYLDTYSQHVWAFKFKTAGSAKTTVESLKSIYGNFIPSETFMTDGGSHFNNETVRNFCEESGSKYHVTPAYSPWVNGLVEGTNKILLHVLKRLCAPELGEDSEEFREMTWETLPATWPEHLDEAVQALNNRILPAFKFAPKELLLGKVVNTKQTLLEEATSVLRPEDVAQQCAYVAQQQLDGYDNILRHAIKRKRSFDRRLLAKVPREVTFRKGDLVQVYRNDLDYTFKAIKKVLPRWSAPRRVVARNINSYILETVRGVRLEGKFSARRLRKFTPRAGTKLDAEQRSLLKKLRKEENEEKEEEIEESDDEEDDDEAAESEEE